ncbi:MAG: hypothetical protein D6B25_05785 [Desulfobulbaceae bacterium]|nr:MAG: hypothetical protein D6B25_05785 [Desulfobulbaceae bacterium]
MSPETLNTIKEAWNKISVDQQRKLIFEYLTWQGNQKGSRWMRFLAEHFKLNGFFPDQHDQSVDLECSK